MNKLFTRIGTFLLLTVVVCRAQTHIVDTLFGATDTSTSTVTGSYTITSQVMNFAGKPVVKSLSKRSISAGVVDVYLPPNDLSSTNGSFYTVNYTITDTGGDTNYTEIWRVPTSSGTVTIPTVRVVSSPTATTHLIPSQITLAYGNLISGNSVGVGAVLAPGTNGQCLTSNGTYPLWSTCTAGGGVAGSNQQLTYNNSGTAAGAAELRYDNVAGRLRSGAFTASDNDAQIQLAGSNGTGNFGGFPSMLDTRTDDPFGWSQTISLKGSTQGVGTFLISATEPAALNVSPINNGAVTANDGRWAPLGYSFGITTGWFGFQNLSPTAMHQVSGGNYGPGSIAVVSGSNAVVGTATYFTESFLVGQTITNDSAVSREIATITDDTHMTTTQAWPTNSTASGYLVPYSGRDLFVVHQNGRVNLPQFGTGVIHTTSGLLSTSPVALASEVSGILPSSNGGAGTVSGALKGNGAGAVSQAACTDLSNAGTGCSATLPAFPSGVIVGTTDTQTLTNKTLDGVSAATMVFVDPTSSIQTQLNGKDASGAATAAQAAAIAASLQRASNLSDLASASSARTNLGLAPVASSGSASDLSAGTTAVLRGGTGTGSTLTGLVRGSASAMTGAELSGDASTSGSNAVLVKSIHDTVTALVFSNSPYAVLTADSVITCDATSGAVVINIPVATGSGRELTLKKIDASPNACTLTRAGSDLIDGATTAPLTVQYASAKIGDTASAVWSRTHVNQLGGLFGGVSTNATCPTCGVTGSPLSQFAATTSAQLAGVLSDESGTGAAVFATSPTLVTPNLGTPSALNAVNATNVPACATCLTVANVAKVGSIVASEFSSTTPSIQPLGATISSSQAACGLTVSNYWPVSGYFRHATLTTGGTNSATVSVHANVNPECQYGTTQVAATGMAPGGAAGFITATGAITDTFAGNIYHVTAGTQNGQGWSAQGASGTGPSVNSVATEFLDDAGTYATVIVGSANANWTINATLYPGAWGTAGATNTTELRSAIPIPVAGTLSNLVVCQTAVSAGSNAVWTVNTGTGSGASSATTITKTMPTTDAARGCYIDSTHTKTVAAGDYFDLTAVTGSSTAGQWNWWSVTFVPSASNSTLVGGLINSTVTTTNNYSLPGSQFTTATQALAELGLPIACSAAKLYVVQAVANSGVTTTFALQKNGVDTAVTGTITAGSGTGAIAVDTTHSASFVQGDLMTLRYVTASGTSGAMGGWSVACN